MLVLMLGFTVGLNENISFENELVKAKRDCAIYLLYIKYYHTVQYNQVQSDRPCVSFLLTSRTVRSVFENANAVRFDDGRGFPVVIATEFTNDIRTF